MNFLELESNNQKQLYKYNNSFLNVADLYDNKKLPNKIIFSGAKGIGKATFAYHLINYIFSKDEKFKYNIKKIGIK